MSNQTIDKACEVEEMMRHYALERFKAANQLKNSVSAFECEDCGEAIPQARRVAVLGCTTCIDCQTERERHAKA